MSNVTDVFPRPDEETVKKMLLDLNEDPQRMEKQTELFKEWIKCESYLPKNVDDQLIINFIRHCKCDLEKAKKKFVNYITLRTKFQSYYKNADLSIYCRDIALQSQFIICPKLSPEGYPLGCMRLPKEISHFDFMKTFHFFLLFMDFALHEDICGGYLGIYDFEHFSAQHLGKLNFKLLAEAVHMCYSVAPFRVKALHILNAPSIPDTLAALLKKILPQKIVDRVYVHKDISTLVKYLPIDIVPKEYGGNGVRCNEACENLKDFFTHNRDWKEKVKDLILMGPVPNQKKEIYSFEDFEMGGSFRKLGID